MYFTPTLYCIFVAIYFTAAEDLKCYTCFFHDGHPYSDSSCLHNPLPGTLKNCTKPTVPHLIYERGPQWHLSLNESTLCHKYTATLNGKMIVIRGCSSELETVHFNCTNDVYVLFEDHIGKDAEACFCSTNNCNNGTSQEPISTPVRPIAHNEASCYRLRSNILIAVIIYSIYKFVS